MSALLSSQHIFRHVSRSTSQYCLHFFDVSRSTSHGPFTLDASSDSPLAVLLSSAYPPRSFVSTFVMSADQVLSLLSCQQIHLSSHNPVSIFIASADSPLAVLSPLLSSTDPPLAVLSLLLSCPPLAVLSPLLSCQQIKSFHSAASSPFSQSCLHFYRVSRFTSRSLVFVSRSTSLFFLPALPSSDFVMTSQNRRLLDTKTLSHDAKIAIWGE